MQASRSLVWVRGVKAALERRDVAIMPSTPVQVDNAGVLAMIKDKTMKAANQHIYRTLCEIRERVKKDKVAHPTKIDTKKNVANALTKQENGLRDSAAQLRLIAGPPSTPCADLCP